MMNADAKFVLLIIAGAIVLYMVGSISRSEGRKRLRSEFSEWRPRKLFVGLVALYGGLQILLVNVPLRGSDPLIRWGPPVLGVILIVIGFFMSVKMIRNWMSKRDSDGTST